jgi:hypothetical protein
MFGGSLGLLNDHVGRKVLAALKRLLGETTLDDSNDDITLLVSSQYAGKVLFKHQGTKRAGMTTRARSAPNSTPPATTAHSTFSRTGTLRHLDSYITSSIGVKVL